MLRDLGLSLSTMEISRILGLADTDAKNQIELPAFKQLFELDGGSRQQF